VENKEPLGIVHGRFQPLHNNHLRDLIINAKNRCDHLIVGITNYNIYEGKKINPVDVHRFDSSNNPFTYYERFEMIKNTMIELGYKQSEFDIVPFPIENPEYLFNFVPKNAVYYITSFDEWGDEKIKILKNLGLNVNVMIKSDLSQKPISATMIRNKIKKGEDWKQYVPKAVFEYITKNHLENKIK